VKTIPIFRWAESANYTADGSGNPWRTGASPTKVLPPAIYSTQGTAPGERYPAQYENSVKNYTGLALQAIEKGQLLRFSRTVGVPATKGYLKVHAPYWNPYQKCWIAVASAGTDPATVVFRDIHGYAYSETSGTTNIQTTATNRSCWFDTGTVSTSYGIQYFTDGATAKTATNFSAFTLTSTGTLGAPVTGLSSAQATVVIGLGNMLACSGAYAALGVVSGTNSGTPCFFTVNQNLLTAVTLPGTPNANAANTFFVTRPSDGSLWGFSGSAANASVYTSANGNPAGPWVEVYNNVSFFGAPLYAPPALDLVNSQWVFTVAKPAAYSYGSLTRFSTSIYTSPVSNPSSIGLLRTFAGISVAKTQDLGENNVVGVYMAHGGSPTGTDAVTLGLCASADAGVTWTVAGSDFAKYTNNTSNPFAAIHITTNFAYAQGKSLLFNYYTSNGTVDFMQFGLHVPVDSLQSY